MNVPETVYGFKRYALHERGMRPRSFRSIMASVKMLCEWADTDDLGQLDHGTVQAFLYWGREEKAWEARTYRNHWQYLKSYFTWCVAQKWVKTNPVEGIGKPKLPQRLPRCLTREDAQTVLNQVRWYPWRYQFEGIRNETILYFLTYTGLRLQEMLDIELLDLNLAAREVLVREGKGQKDRIVPLHPRLVPILRNYLAERKTRHNHSRFLFTGAQSELPMTGKDVRSVCKKLSASTGIYFTPHRLRHTFARLMIEADVDLFKIKEIMGHAHIATTHTYVSVSTENLKRSMNAAVLL